jgi:predicted transcriptional regulator
MGINWGMVPQSEVHVVYDEILDAKVKLEYEKPKLSSNPREDWVRKREHEIQRIILKYDDGISHGKLARTIGINRKNLQPYMKRLVDKRLTTRGEGLHGKYYPTTKARRGISLTADILAKSFVSSILDNDKFLIDNPTPNTYPSKFSELEREVLKLSNMFGGFITYTLIQSMNPENKIAQSSSNALEKDIVVQAWLEDTISIFIQNILSRFKDRVFPHLESIDGGIPPNASDSEIFDKAAKDYLKFFHKRPFFTLDQRFISELINCFSNLYPNLGHNLERIRSELPNLLAQEVNHIRYVAEKAKLQKTCTHKYKRPLNESYDDHRFEHCQKCHKTRRKEN